jgi:hypothetical protein
LLYRTAKLRRLASGRPWKDTRIIHKMCQPLADAGCEV